MSLHPDLERVALLGWRLHPASQYSRAACIKQAAELATCDLDRLEQWSFEFPGCNWRVVLGGSGIWALDVDVPSPDHAADGMKALADLVTAQGRPIPPRPMTRSGGGGWALFFKHDGEPIAGRTGTPAPGIDPRRGRLTVTVPPSLHLRTRQPYRWLTAPWEVNPPPAPEWLLKLVAPPPEPSIPEAPRMAYYGQRGRHYAVGALRRAVEQVAAAPAGQRNCTLNRATWSICRRFVADGLLQPSEIAEALAHAARVAGLDRMEVQQTLTSALASGTRR
jgi:Bifunctional DNA primase/polymerase, N-terminal